MVLEEDGGAGACHPYLAGGGAVQSGDQVEQGRLARPGGAQQADELAFRHAQVDAVEHRPPGAPGPVDLADAPEFDGGTAGGGGRGRAGRCRHGQRSHGPAAGAGARGASFMPAVRVVPSAGSMRRKAPMARQSA